MTESATLYSPLTKSFEEIKFPKSPYLTLSNTLAQSKFSLNLIESRIISILLYKSNYICKFNLENFSSNTIIPIFPEEYNHIFQTPIPSAKRNLLKFSKSNLPLITIIDDEIPITFPWLSYCKPVNNVLYLCLSPQLVQLTCGLESQFTTIFLKETVNFSTKYSFNFYLNLKSRFNYQKSRVKTVKLTLKSLHNSLNISENSHYCSNFSAFKQQILTPVIKELNNTDFFNGLEAIPIKFRREIVGIKFNLPNSANFLKKSPKISPPGPDYL